MRQTPVIAALNVPRLTYGISSAALGYCWGPFALAAVLVGTSAGWLWSLIPIAMGMAIHALLRWAYKKDTRIFSLYQKYAILAPAYHPNARDDIPEPFSRPSKVGRGIRL